MYGPESDFLEERTRSTKSDEWRRLWQAEMMFLRNDPTAFADLLALADNAESSDVRCAAYCALGQHADDVDDSAASSRFLEMARNLAAITHEGPAEAVTLLGTSLQASRREGVDIGMAVASDLCRLLVRKGESKRAKDILLVLGSGSGLGKELQDLLDSIP